MLSIRSMNAGAFAGARIDSHCSSPSRRPQRVNSPPPGQLIVNIRLALTTVVMLACSGSGDTPNLRSNTPIGSVDAVSLPTVPEPPFDSASLAGLTCIKLMDSVFLAPSTRAALLQTYGTPDSVNASTEPNRHVAGAIDSLFQVQYSGLTASFRKPAEGSDLITQLEATENRYLRYPSIGIGARGDRLVQVLNDASLVTDDRVEYNCGMGADEPVTFWLVRGQIRRVSKSYYVD